MFRTTGSPSPRQITLFSFPTSSHQSLHTPFVDFVKCCSDRPKWGVRRNISGIAHGCNSVPLTALEAYLWNDDSYVRNMAGITISWINQNARRTPPPPHPRCRFEACKCLLVCVCLPFCSCSTLSTLLLLSSSISLPPTFSLPPRRCTDVLSYRISHTLSLVQARRAQLPKFC